MNVINPAQVEEVKRRASLAENVNIPFSVLKRIAQASNENKDRDGSGGFGTIEVLKGAFMFIALRSVFPDLQLIPSMPVDRVLNSFQGLGPPYTQICMTICGCVIAYQERPEYNDANWKAYRQTFEMVLSCSESVSGNVWPPDKYDDHNPTRHVIPKQKPRGIRTTRNIVHS